MSEYAFEGPKRSSTSINWSFATTNYLSDASTPFSHVLGTAVQSTIEAAFARWAAVSGLTFTQVADSASVPIRVGFEGLAQVELGETDFRSANGVLANDTLIRLLDPSTSPLFVDASGAYYYPLYDVTLFQVALHEIGHALGLDHTTDPGTVMYPYATTSNPDLAAGDIEGINTLYPYFTVAAPQPAQAAAPVGQTATYAFVITRYSDPAVALTIHYAVTGVAYPTVAYSIAATASEFVGGAYPSGQLTFAAGSSTAMLSISVAGTSVAQPDEGFAISLSSLNASDSVVVRGQVNAVILDDHNYAQVSGNSVGIYRFFDRSNGAHFFSASEAERNTLIETRQDLTYEGLGLRAVASPATDPAAVAVYRFFDMTNGTHFYSISAVERDSIVAKSSTLTYEGTAFYEHSTSQSGDTPVYRFFDTTDGSHFFTASASERASILATRSDLHYEGVGFYAPSA